MTYYETTCEEGDRTWRCTQEGRYQCNHCTGFFCSKHSGLRKVFAQQGYNWDLRERRYCDTCWLTERSIKVFGKKIHED